MNSVSYSVKTFWNRKSSVRRIERRVEDRSPRVVLVFFSYLQLNAFTTKNIFLFIIAGDYDIRIRENSIYMPLGLINLKKLRRRLEKKLHTFSNNLKNMN